MNALVQTASRLLAGSAALQEVAGQKQYLTFMPAAKCLQSAPGSSR